MLIIPFVLQGFTTKILQLLQIAMKSARPDFYVTFAQGEATLEKFCASQDQLMFESVGEVSRSQNPQVKFLNYSA